MIYLTNTFTQAGISAICFILLLQGTINNLLNEQGSTTRSDQRIIGKAQPVKGNDGVIFRKCESFLFHILLQTPFPGNP